MIYDGDRREHAESEIVKQLADTVMFHDLDTKWRTILLAFILKTNFGTVTWQNMYLKENRVYETFLRMVTQCSADLLAYFSLISSKYFLM